MKILFFLVCFIITSPALAEGASFLSSEQIAKHKTTIERVEKYLSGLSTIVSDFTQVAPDGSLATGKFYMQRPGKMRWQYNPPTPVLMVADGKVLTYYDYELQQINYIRLDDTVIGFLSRDPITLSGDIGILEVEEKDGAIRVAIAQKDKPEEGALLLEFADKPLQIRNMTITDATGQTTTVSLNKARYGVDINKKLFEFKDPRPPSRR